MENSKAPRTWIWMSSSTGETFFKMWDQLPSSAQSSFKGAYFDRPCAGFELAKKRFSKSTQIKVECLEKSALELSVSADLDMIQESEGSRPLILLCGFLRILSSSFIQNSQTLIFNTHPSLLPSYPGVAEKVHKKIFHESTLGGFSFHLVDETLDGGPVLFSHPFQIDPTSSFEEYYQRSRSIEQRFLPEIWALVLSRHWEVDDVRKSSIQIRKEKKIFLPTVFENMIVKEPK